AERALLQQFGNQAVLMLPLVVGRIPQVFGLIELFRKANSRPFAPGELAMAESFASQAAVALENARLYEEKQRQAVIDELCGIYNRRGLFELARIEFERSQRFNRPLALLFIDIDHFKQFNDRYSYAVGDQVLRQVADCIGVKVREFDLLGRYGGEEFVVLLPEADAKVARQVAERVRQAVQRLSISTGLDETSVTVSIGVAYKDLATENLETLLELAGQALHEAKNAGRNRVVAAGGSNLFGAAAGSSSLAAAEPAAPAVVPPTSPGASPPPGPAWR
ncbi:MAG: sensor domain-containing diguanylate cyclase, partial [Chloroflexota bacterium]